MRLPTRYRLSVRTPPVRPERADDSSERPPFRSKRISPAATRWLLSHLRHSPARFGATATGVGASLHHLVVAAHRATIGLAGATDFRARAARFGVVLRSEQHSLRAGAANFCAGQECADVAVLGVLASELQAVLHRLEADGIAVKAVVDTLTQLGSHVLRVRHDYSSEVVETGGTYTHQPRRLPL